MISAANISYQSIEDSIVRWLDSSIVIVGSEEMGMGLHARQKFTLGDSSPYFLQQHFRYVGENVQFVCEYKVLGETGVKAIFSSSWWKEDGFPVDEDDRLFINVTLRPLNDIFMSTGMQQYIVRNTLKVTMLVNYHYGRYTLKKFHTGKNIFR